MYWFNPLFLILQWDNLLNCRLPSLTCILFESKIPSATTVLLFCSSYSYCWCLLKLTSAIFKKIILVLLRDSFLPRGSLLPEYDSMILQMKILDCCGMGLLWNHNDIIGHLFILAIQPEEILILYDWYCTTCTYITSHTIWYSLLFILFYHQSTIHLVSKWFVI